MAGVCSWSTSNYDLYYIEDAHFSYRVFSFTLFADDPNIFYKKKNSKNTSLNQLPTITNIELHVTKLSVRFKTNKLTLNISKTNYMLKIDEGIVKSTSL